MITDVLVLNGPNLGRLGIREPDVYGTATLEDLAETCRATGRQLDLHVEVRQTDDEAELIRWVHEAADARTPVVLNPAAFTHYSYALRDALAMRTAPLVEVHLSNPAARESFRHTSVVAGVADGTVAGFGLLSYQLALQAIADLAARQGPGPGAPDTVAPGGTVAGPWTRRRCRRRSDCADRVHGAGKTTVGQLLSGQLGLPFLDADAVIEERAGCPVPQIFAERGEPAFRELEHETIAGLLAGDSGPRMVLALGGGAVEDARTRRLLIAADVVYLHVPYAGALARIGGDAGRPMLSRPDLEAVYRRRLAAYQAVATHTVRTDGRAPADVCGEIVSRLGVGGSASHRLTFIYQPNVR